MDKPGALIIVGFTGDLSRRKLLPSLYNLERAGRLPADMKIYGVVRRPTSVADVADELDTYIIKAKGSCDSATLKALCARIETVEADVSSRAGADVLKKQLDELIGPVCKLKLFHFAVPPAALSDIIRNLAASGVHMCGGSPDSRLLIEKPFGRDVASATDLSQTIRQYFGEDSIYLIDHYLAKDTVQNMLHVRFHNPMLRSLWSGKDIKCIQISALEELDIQGRGNFYEQTGALRDMLQSHLMQILAIVTMDEPKTFTSEVIRRNKLKLLSKVRLAGDPSDSAVRSQYDGYRSEVENEDSRVETFAAVKLEIDNNRWHNVPVYLRAGKAMSEKLTQVDIVFKDDSGSDDKDRAENVFTFRLQPHEGIAMRILIKRPGLDTSTKPVTLDYCYHDSDDGDALSGGYDKILLDAINGDQTLFPSDAEIMNNWQLFQPVLDVWESHSKYLGSYAKGAESVDAGSGLLDRDGAEWVEHAAWVCSELYK